MKPNVHITTCQMEEGGGWGLRITLARDGHDDDIYYCDTVDLTVWTEAPGLQEAKRWTESMHHIVEAVARHMAHAHTQEAMSAQRRRPACTSSYDELTDALTGEGRY